MEQLLSYDDVLLRPQKTSIESLSDVDTSINLAGIDLEAPIISAPMDTVTERNMAEAMAKNGGIGVVHRFLTPKEQCKEVNGISPVGAAVGLNEHERCEMLVDAGADILVADIAHGHHEAFLNYVEEITERFDVPIMAGNVATIKGAKELAEAGADAVKIGIGPGAACTTRKMTGAGIPQFSAVRNTSNISAQVIADGGIRKPGDMVKALMAGADSIMVGSILGKTHESPRQGNFRGMSTKSAAEDRTDRGLKESDTYEEGKEFESDETSTVKQVFDKYLGGLKSGLSYCGSDNILGSREKAEFVRITQNTRFRNGAHEKHR